MEKEKAKVVCLKHIKIKYFSPDSSKADVKYISQVEVDAFYYEDGTIVGKIEYPFSIVVGKYFENTGVHLAILDEETGNLPIYVLASVMKDGKPNTFYGVMALYDPKEPEEEYEETPITVTSDNLIEFEQESISSVAEKIIYGTKLISDANSSNTHMYDMFCGFNNEKYLQNIETIKLELEKCLFKEEFIDLDLIEIDEDE
jgi:hypothetical protein